MLGMTILRNVKQNADDKALLGRRRDPRPEQRQDLQACALKPVDGGKQAGGARLHRHADARPHADLDPRRMTPPTSPTGATMNSIQRPQGRRARRRRDGRADRRASGQRQGAGGAVRPARKEGPKNGIVIKAIDGLKKLKPAPLGVPEDAALIQPANYEEHLELLEGLRPGDRGDRRAHGLEARSVPARSRRTSRRTRSSRRNTSGLSITKLSEALPEEIKPRFCGIHFFNPPRYMRLVELIATPTTEPEVLDQLEAFVTSALGKGVVRAKDTPNFIANRVGIVGMLATIHEAEKFGLELRRGRRPHRQEARPRQERHLPHRRRGRPGHDGARHQDAAGQPRTDDPFFASFATPPVLRR